MNIDIRLRQFAENIRDSCRHSGFVMPSSRVFDAMATVPRHLFVEKFRALGLDPFSHEFEMVDMVVDHAAPDLVTMETVYSDQVLVTRIGADGVNTSSASQPSLVAQMLETLDIQPGMSVLEIGAGTGYNAALMAELIGDQRSVTSVDNDVDVIAQTRRLATAAGYGRLVLVSGDGYAGAPDRAPFDRIIASVGCPDISWNWVDQLSPEAVMVVPLQHGGPNATPLVKFTPTRARELAGDVVSWTGFLPLEGRDWEPIWPESLGELPQFSDSAFELPPALAEAPFSGESWLDGQRAWWDFAFFLALVDQRTHFGHVLALVDPGGDRLVFTDEWLLLFGDDTTLADQAWAAYRQWDELGRPAVPDWSIRMVPRSQPRPASTQSTSVFARPESWQITTLA